MPAFKPPGQCPACGEWVPRNAAACDCCGACASSGWKMDADVYDGLDLPDKEDFDYNEFVEKEFGGGGKEQKRRRFWWWVAVLLALAMAYGLLAPMWH
ncbi:MAG: hypothetical protein JWO89_300 [Verrucomicrobiaceae bacterium]|nr:hypothetical protein [Verrucomicrobiaceae bacterium]